jgi:hypothetical protein
MVSIANVTQIRGDGSLTCGLAGVAIGVTGFVYCNQAPTVRDEGAIRLTSAAALVMGAVALGRRIRFVREQERRRISLLLDPASGGHVGLRILLGRPVRGQTIQPCFNTDVR